MSRSPLLVAALLLSVWTLTGCTIHDATPTVLQLDGTGPDNEAQVAFGVEHIGWQLEAEQPLVIGHGSHPRSHEDYAYLFNEPYQPYQQRWLRIAPLPDGRMWQVELGIVPALWPGAASRRPDAGPSDLIWLQGEAKLRPLRDARQLRFELDAVPMRPTGEGEEEARVLLSGEVEAMRETPETFDARRTSLERREPSTTADAGAGW